MTKFTLTFLETYTIFNSIASGTWVKKKKCGYILSAILSHHNLFPTNHGYLSSARWVMMCFVVMAAAVVVVVTGQEWRQSESGGCVCSAVLLYHHHTTRLLHSAHGFSSHIFKNYTTYSEYKYLTYTPWRSYEYCLTLYETIFWTIIISCGKNNNNNVN